MIAPARTTHFTSQSSALLATPLFYKGVVVPEMPENAQEKMLAELCGVIVERREAAAVERTGLRDAVCEYARAERARGTSAAHVLETVTGIVRNAEIVDEHAAEGLARTMVNWCGEFRGNRPVSGEQRIRLVQ